MDELSKTNKLIGILKRAIVFFLLSFVAYIVLSEKVFDYIVLTNLPITNISKVFVVHMIANLVLFLSSTILGITFIKLYLHLKNKLVPFVGFIWIFGGFKLFMGLIFFMNMVSIWRAYFWIDAMIRIGAAIFAAGAAISFINSYGSIRAIRTPEHYQKLKDEIERVSKIQQEILNVKPHNN